MLEDIKGLKEKNIKILNKLNIYNKNDLLTYYPFRYNYLKKTDFNNIENDKVIIDGIVLNIPYLVYIKGNLNKMSFKLKIYDRIVNIVIFNRGFLRGKLKINSEITVIGKYDAKRNLILASEIRFGKLNDIPTLEPIYHLTSGITSKQLNEIINKVDIDIIDYIPSYLIQKYSFLSKEKSISIIHNPSNVEELKQARLRLKYEELFMFMCKINYLKNNNVKNTGLKRNIPYSKVEEFINNLPFKLTSDQTKACMDIYNDLISNKRMNRLLQGDVGSGKTIVSFIAIYINSLSNYQSVLMAPTEILAIQHYNNIKKILPDINISLLTGKLKPSEKKKIYNDIKNGNSQIIIGTHALFSEDVVYNNLGLVITDEQHRFGVNQRASLKNKGLMPDILYMSATPIPRTYALTLYGDMDISSIKTMPSGRLPVVTTIKTNNEIKQVLDMMYSQIKLGHQIYVISPLIDGENEELESVYSLEENLNKALGSVAKIGVLHGKMKNDEKDSIMSKFKNNEIQILISTTVIEVGVDVANATMIVIYDAYLFGLSQLHQLRGRVGRNNIQSYCILISDRQPERLKVLCDTNDGFKVSEEDFKLRGSGDIFGIRQSGDMNFLLADVKRDFSLLLKAKEDCKEFFYKYINSYSIIKNIIISSVNLD